MAINQARLARLAEFGLKTHAARAYLALLGLGEAQAGALSAAAHVPTSKLYAVLTKLEARGLVEVIPDFPRRYRAIPFDTFLASEIRAQRANLERLEAAREAFAAEFVVDHLSPPGSADGFALLKGRRALAVRLDDALARAEDVLFVAGSPSVHWLSRRRGLLAERVAAGARIRILASAPASLPGEVRVGSVSEVVLLVLVDGRTAFLAPFRAMNGDEDEEASLALASPDMVAGLRAMAESAWAAAEEVRAVPVT